MNKFYDEFRKRNLSRVAAIKRLTTCRFTLDVSRFINSRNTCIDCDQSMMGIENAFWELNIDYDSPIDTSDYIDEARGILRSLVPDMPARMVDDDALEDDIRRAVSDACRDDYCEQFNRYLMRGVEDSIEASMPDGARWAWSSDYAGAATAEYYECSYIVVAMPAKLARDPAAVWNQEARSDTPADEALQEYIIENVEDRIDPCDFDDSGGRYGDDDGWPDRLREYCETADAWKSDVRAMRAKLRAMIASRAPLSARAALVATVYGEA